MSHLRGLNKVDFSEDGDQVTVGGGATNGEWVDAALANGRQVRKYCEISSS